MLGMTRISTAIPAGHALTRRDYHCGNFRDEFDWSSMPLTYRARIGAPTGERHD